MTASCSLGNLPAHNIIPLIPAQAGIQYRVLGVFSLSFLGPRFRGDERLSQSE
jgi:hypothetical protein